MGTGPISVVLGPLGSLLVHQGDTVDIGEAMRLWEQGEAQRPHRRRYVYLVIAAGIVWALAQAMFICWGSLSAAAISLSACALMALASGLDWRASRYTRRFWKWYEIELQIRGGYSRKAFAGYDLYGFPIGVLAGWECEDAHLPGECPLCGAD